MLDHIMFGILSFLAWFWFALFVWKLRLLELGDPRVLLVSGVVYGMMFVSLMFIAFAIVGVTVGQSRSPVQLHELMALIYALHIVFWVVLTLLTAVDFLANGIRYFRKDSIRTLDLEH